MVNGTFRRLERLRETYPFPVYTPHPMGIDIPPEQANEKEAAPKEAAVNDCFFICLIPDNHIGEEQPGC